MCVCPFTRLLTRELTLHVYGHVYASSSQFIPHLDPRFFTETELFAWLNKDAGLSDLI